MVNKTTAVYSSQGIPPRPQTLRTRRNEIHWSNVYKRHNQWSKDGSYQKLFSASIIHLKETKQLDTSIIHGDGSNTVVKKGVQASVTQDTSTSLVPPSNGRTEKVTKN